MGELDMDNILVGDEAANLFIDSDSDTQDTSTETEESSNKEDTLETKSTAEVTSEELFDSEDQPESVGSVEDKKGKEGPSSKDGASPNQKNFYSSIASALKEEGALPDLEDTDIDSIDKPEDFVEAIKKQVEAGMDAQHKRVLQALNNNVQPSVIKKYEDTLNFLNNINEDLLDQETSEANEIRKKLIQLDFMNKGYTAERAFKLTQRIFNSGDDIEEAKNALDSNKEFFEDKYQEILDEAELYQLESKEKTKLKVEALKNDILNTETVLGDIKLDKRIRLQIVDNITKPVYKDTATGITYTAIDKFNRENPDLLLKYMGIFYTLTNGFKDIKNLVKSQTKKEMKSKLRELEHTLNNTNRNNNGSLNYIGGADDNSSILNGFSIDI